MAEEQQAQQTVFTIEKIYVKDLSLEVPGAPKVFLERDTPRVDVSLSTQANSVDDSHYDVVLSVTEDNIPDETKRARSDEFWSGVLTTIKEMVESRQGDPLPRGARPNVAKW